MGSPSWVQAPTPTHCAAAEQAIQRVLHSTPSKLFQPGSRDAARSGGRLLGDRRPLNVGRWEDGGYVSGNGGATTGLAVGRSDRASGWVALSPCSRFSGLVCLSFTLLLLQPFARFQWRSPLAHSHAAGAVKGLLSSRSCHRTAPSALSWPLIACLAPARFGPHRRLPFVVHVLSPLSSPCRLRCPFDLP